MTVIDAASDWSELSRLYASAETLLKMGAWECDLATERLSWTPGVYDLFDLPRGSHVERRRVVELYEETSRAGLEALRAEALRTGLGFSLDARIVTAAGQRRWMRLNTDVVLENGRATRLLGTKQDVTREKAEWDQLRLRAERDPLTGLANRDTFERRLRSALDDGEGLAALLIVDVDHFKSINDRFGHAAGDAVLSEVARRLTRIFADARVVARIGGDEFAVLLSARVDRQKIGAIGTRAIRQLKQPVLWNARPIALSASIGVTLVDGARRTRDDLFADADAALYAAKASGRGTCRLSGIRAEAGLSLRLA